MKIKEGGVMDIQSLKEFEAWWSENYDRDDFEDVVFSEILNEYESNYIVTDDLNKAWLAWQAKAQAVPEGYVVVPMEPTDEIIEAMNEFDYRNDYSDMDGAYRAIVETLEKAQAVPDVVNNRKWISCADVRACRKKAMTEAAQEQTND